MPLQQSAYRLVFAESSMNMTYGSSYDLAVEVNNISNLSGIKIVIQFEPYYLSVNSLQQGDFFAESDNIAFLNEFDNNNGRIEIDMSALGLDNGKTGSGVLARINLLAQNTGTTSLNFLQGEMIIRDASNNDISIQSFGSCTISIN